VPAVSCGPEVNDHGKEETGKRGKKLVYSFGGGSAEGSAKDKELLGGKGANLAEMAGLGLPVPPGFTITTEVCATYDPKKGTYPSGLARKSTSISRASKR